MFGHSVGRRSRRISALLVMVIACVATVSCATASHTARTATLAQAEANCAVVGRALGAAPGHQANWIREIITVPRSGILTVDAAMLKLAEALRENNIAKSNQAFSGTVRACSQLGLWHTYH